MSVEIKKPKLHTAIEIALWIIVCTALLLYNLYSKYFYLNDFNQYGNIFKDGVLYYSILLIPIFTVLIFNKLPIEIVRIALSAPQPHSKTQVKQISQTPNVAIEKKISAPAPTPKLQEKGSDKEILLNKYTNEARERASKQFQRAGAFLLAGTLIAVAGVYFFYTQTSELHSANKITKSSAAETQPATPYIDGGASPSSDKIFSPSIIYLLISNFGILFFIEFIALFFLKQYRGAMDEFRHYDAIARSREEISALIELFDKSEHPEKIMNLVKSGFFFSKGNLLLKDQTTETIEARKLEKGELDLLGKIVDSIPKPK